MLHLRTIDVIFVQAEPGPYEAQSASDVHQPQVPASVLHTEPDMRIAHSSVALQVAQVEVTVEQIGFDSGQVEDELHVLHSPDTKSQDSKLSDADQHWA